MEQQHHRRSTPETKKEGNTTGKLLAPNQPSTQLFFDSYATSVNFHILHNTPS